MSASERIRGHVPAIHQVAAIEIMGVAEVYAATGTYPDGFPLPTHQHGTAAELVRLGYLTEPTPHRFMLATSREVIL